MRLAVRPYGVLGSFKTRSGAVNKVMPVPAPGFPFIDPAGLHHIQQHGPQDAAGASGQIYQFLGIQNDTQFPAAVRAAIQAPCQAKLHYYGQKACLHVVGPNFNGRDCSREQAVDELTAAYGALLRQFGQSRLGGLRLLPVSGGIFAGPFTPDLPELTCTALRRAFDRLPGDLQHIVSVARLDMCIFDESELEAYVTAFEGETERAQEFADSLQMGCTPKM